MILLNNHLRSILVMGLVTVVMLAPTPLRLDNIQFLLLSIFPVVLLLFVKNITIRFQLTDLYWGVFVILGFLSANWAIDTSFVWNQLFIWIIMLLWMFMFRSIEISTQFYLILQSLIGGLFVLSTMYFFTAIFIFNLSTWGSWNSIFGYNSNYTATLFVILYPFVLFWKLNEKYAIYLKSVLTLLLVIILFISQAKGAALSFLAVILYYAHYTKPKYFQLIKKPSYLITYLILLIPFLLMVYNYTWIMSTLSKIDRYRSHIITSSFLIFLEHPFTGIGLGNWHIEGHKFSNALHPSFDQSTITKTVGSHNIYTQLLAELGIFGFAAFTIPIVFRLFKNSFHDAPPIYRAALCSLLVYVLTSFFYQTANSFQFFFSKIQFIGFCSLGILTNNSRSKPYRQREIKTFFLSLSTVVLIWFSLSLYKYKSFVNIQFDNAPAIKNAIGAIENIYHSQYWTSHGIDILLPHELAKLYELTDSTRKAHLNYQESINIAPYNFELLLDYSIHLYNSGSYSSARNYALRAYNLSPSNKEVNYLLVLLDTATDNINFESNLHLDKAYPDYEDQKSVLETFIYSSEFWMSELKLTKRQRESFLPIKEAYMMLKDSYVDCIGYFRNRNQFENCLSNNSSSDMKSASWLFEKQFFLILDSVQRNIYLTRSLSSEIQSDNISIRKEVPLENSQIESISLLVEQYNIEEKKLKYLTLPQVERTKYQDSLLSDLDIGVLGILHPYQRDSYIRYSINKNLSWAFSTIYSSSLNRNLGLLDRLKTVVIKYIFTNLEQSNTKQYQNNDIFFERRNRFLNDVNLILEPQQFIEFQKLFLTKEKIDVMHQHYIPKSTTKLRSGEMSGVNQI